MDWIEAALAFAVVMMLLSTAVTVIMEAAHNLLRIREKGLRRMVEGVYDDVIVPRLPPLPGDATTGSFVNTVTGARYLPVRDASGRGIKSWFRHLVYNTVNAAQLKQLTSLEFVERLAETPAGRRLFEESQRRGEEYLDTFLGDLASKFEDFSRSSSEYFARRARLTSTVIAIALAFSINVNAIEIYESLLLDTDLRQSLVERGEAVGAQVEEAEKRRADLAAGQSPGEFSREDLDKDVEELKSIVNSLKSSGLPIGWDSAPWYTAGWADNSSFESFRVVVGWVLSVLLAGLLVGLGGPFWFNVFRKLGALAGMPSNAQKAKELGGTATGVDAQSFSRVFQEAAKADALADPVDRAPLTRDGHADEGSSR